MCAGSANRIVQNALNNKRLEEMGVPVLREIWIKWLVVTVRRALEVGVNGVQCCKL